MNVHTVLFDLDGLLVDSESAWYRTRTELARDYGAVWTESDQRAQAGVHTDCSHWTGSTVIALC
jgi:beta-phosphoglucomutase-like phosphatase (HAD superfamily)